MESLGGTCLSRSPLWIRLCSDRLLTCSLFGISNLSRNEFLQSDFSHTCKGFQIRFGCTTQTDLLDWCGFHAELFVFHEVIRPQTLSDVYLRQQENQHKGKQYTQSQKKIQNHIDTKSSIKFLAFLELHLKYSFTKHIAGTMNGHQNRMV